jgi:cytidine deaminase
MRVVKKQIEFTEYDTIDQLTSEDQSLLKDAIKISHTAYAPYSDFKVGAAILLSNGEVVIGNNQENIAYPSGLCAERVAIFHAGATHPNEPIDTIAIYAESDVMPVDTPISPCGACRQVIMEYRQKQTTPIRVILKPQQGNIWIFECVTDLLPFAFDLKGLKKQN